MNSIIESFEDSSEMPRTPVLVRRPAKYQTSLFSSSSSEFSPVESKTGDKENTIAINESNTSNDGINNAPSSTPFNCRDRPRLESNFPKIVLRPLTDEEISQCKNSANVETYTRNLIMTKNESQTHYSTSVTTRKRKLPVQIDISEGIGRPKRSKAPSNFAEPKLNIKMRRT